MFFNKNKTSIQLFKSTTKPSNDIDYLSRRIRQLDQSILETQNQLIKIAKAAMRAAYSDRTWLNNLSKRIYIPVIKESAKVYIKNLYQLNIERRKLQVTLDKITGQFWKKRLQQCLALIFAFLLLFFTAGGIVMGILIMISLIPIWFSCVYLASWIRRDHHI